MVGAYRPLYALKIKFLITPTAITAYSVRVDIRMFMLFGISYLTVIPVLPTVTAENMKFDTYTVLVKRLLSEGVGGFVRVMRCVGFIWSGGVISGWILNIKTSFEEDEKTE